MKVIHYGLSSNFGGIESYLLKISKLIDTKNFEFSFLDMTADELPYKNEIEKLGMKIYKITPRSISIKKNKKELNQLFSINNFDILHYHANTLSYVTPIEVALKKNCKVILHSRSSNAPDSYITKALHHYNYIKLPFNQIEKVAVSNNAGNWLFKNNSYDVLNNGIEIDHFQFDKNKRENYRKKLKIKSEFLIGHIGAFTYAKNHEFILTTFIKFNKSIENSKLVLVGNGVKKMEIIESVKKFNLQDKVILIDNTSDVASYLSSFDVMIFPSFYEGYPNIVLEAQTNGLPIIISNTITKEVMLTDNCFSLPIDSEKIWVEKLLELQKNKLNTTFREAQANRIRDLGKDVSKEIKLIENLYKKVYYENYKEDNVGD